MKRTLGYIYSIYSILPFSIGFIFGILIWIPFTVGIFESKEKLKALYEIGEKNEQTS